MKRQMPSYLTVKGQYPYDFYEELRAAAPTGVHWDEEMRAWLLLKHADCRSTHRNEDTFAHPYMDMPGAVEVHGGERGILMLEGPDHAKLHRFLISFFSPRRVAEYRERYVRPLLARLFDKFDQAGRADLDPVLAAPLPAYVICGLLGVPLGDEVTLANCKKWNEEIMRWSGTFGEDVEVLETAKRAARNLKDVLWPIIQERRVNPSDDLISTLWRDGPDLLENWSEADVLAQARVMLFAGAESTSHLLRNSIYLLLTRPDLQDALRADTSRIPNFVDETMRYLGVIHFHIRRANEDTEISGCPIAKGDRLHPILAAANRDPERFEAPLEFKLDRPNSKDHLGFGFGPRMCVGAFLARAEAAEMVEELLKRCPDLRFEGEPNEAVMTGHMPRSFSPLQAKWTVGRR